MNRSYGQLLFGLAIVALGVGFLLNSLGSFDLSTTIGTWWPSIIILLGLASLLSNPRIALWPLFIVAFGVLMQLKLLGVLEFNVWSIIWPSALIIFGISIIMDRAKPNAKVSDETKTDLFVAFSGINSKNTSSDFRGGKLTSLFGGIVLDLTEAKIQDKATIDVFSAFGGSDIKVPEGWNVVITGLPLFGGWEDKTKKSSDTSAPTLRIRGTALFGGFGVKNG